MKKQTTNIVLFAAIAAIVIIATLADRRSAPPTADKGKPAKTKTVKKDRPRTPKTAIPRPNRAAANKNAAIPTFTSEMDESALAAWLAPRPPRTGDEMENIPEDEEEYPIRQLDAQTRFRRAVFQMLADNSLVHDAFGRKLLSSQTASLRSLGAVLLVEKGAFTAADAEALANDADAAVPLSVLEWIRERGTPEQLASLEAALAARGLSADDLVAVLTSLSSATGGAREALDLLIKTVPADDLPDLLAAVASAEAAAYDVRMQSLMALRGVAPFSVADNVMVKIELAAEPPSESLWGESIDLYSDLVDLAANDKAPYKVWDVLTRDLEFLTSLDYENSVRAMANYVENGVRGDDPVIQEGSWRIIDAYIAQVKASDYAKDAASSEPLERLIRLNGKLKPFDPEFAVPDPDPDPAAEATEEEQEEETEEEAETPQEETEEETEEPEEKTEERQTFDANGNPTGSGATTVPIGVERVEPYKP